MNKTILFIVLLWSLSGFSADNAYLELNCYVKGTISQASFTLNIPLKSLETNAYASDEKEIYLLDNKRLIARASYYIHSNNQKQSINLTLEELYSQFGNSNIDLPGSVSSNNFDVTDSFESAYKIDVNNSFIGKGELVCKPK